MSSEQSVSESPGPWYRQVDGQQGRAFLATFFGWLLDGFDFTIMTFILIDIQESFTVDAALAARPAAPEAVTNLRRFMGSVIPCGVIDSRIAAGGTGALADRRFGRQGCLPHVWEIQITDASRGS